MTSDAICLVISLLLWVPTSGLARPSLLAHGWYQAQALTPAMEEQIREAVYLNQQGWDALMRGETQAAQATFEKALALFRQTGARAGEAVSLNRLGNVYDYTRQFDKAIPYYQEALKIYRELGLRDGEWAVLADQGDLYFEMGRLEDATQVYEQSLTIVRQLKDHRSERYRLDALARVYFRQGRNADAIKTYQESVAVHLAQEDYEGQAAALSNLGIIYAAIGEYAQALDAYEQALSLYVTRLTAFQGAKAVVLNNMASVYFSLGQYQRALELSRNALKLFDQLGLLDAKEAFGAVNLVYDTFGQYSRPLEFQFQGQAVRQEAGDAFGKGELMSKGRGATLTNMAQLLINAGQLDQGLQVHQQALKVYLGVKDKAGEAIALSNIGYVYERQGRFEQALQHYQQALELYRQLGDRTGEGVALSNLGQTYARLKRSAEALKFYQQALTKHREVADRTNEAMTLRNLGRLYLDLGQFADASKTLLTAVTVLESLRPGLSDANKVSIFETQARTYGYLQQALVAQNQIEAALEISERGRARAFVELLAQRLDNSPAIATPPPITSAQIKQIARDGKGFLVEYALIEDELSVQGKLRTRAVKLLIWVVRPDGKIDFRQVDLREWMRQQGQEGQFLEDLVLFSRASIGVRGRSLVFNENPEVIPVAPVATTSQLDQQRLRQLYRLLIQPISDLLPTDPQTRITFVPQKSLFLVPFPALLDANSQYLIERHTVLTVPAIQILQLTQQQAQQRRRTQNSGNNLTIAQQFSPSLIVGNPFMPRIRFNPTAPPQQLAALPAAEQEAREIAAILETQPLVGPLGTKAMVLTQLPTARIVHLATHGLLDDFKRVGVPGAIALAPSPGDDGLLTTREILDLRLEADLVVLSACDTGGGILTGDGVIGLSRAWIVAGATSIVVSLWQVPDAQTAFLMTHFYRNLKSGADKAQALRQAMLATLKEYPAPKDWAAFTLMGEPD